MSEICSSWPNAMTFEVGVAEMPLWLRGFSYVFRMANLGRQGRVVKGGYLNDFETRQPN
jgi:hypothetical protein